MKKVFVAGLVLAMSVAILGSAQAEAKTSHTTLLIGGAVATTVAPSASFNATGFVTYDTGAATHLAKGGTVTVTIYSDDTCDSTGGVESSVGPSSLTNGAYTAGMTAPATDGTYGVRTAYSGKAANDGPGPELASSTSPCRVLTVLTGGNGPGNGTLTTECRVPAAPAIANEWMREEGGLKPGSPTFKNIDSLVASGNEVNDFTQDTITERVPGWRVPMTPPGAPSADVWEPRCLLSGDVDPNDPTIFVLDENPDFRPLVEAYTQYAFNNRVSK